MTGSVRDEAVVIDGVDRLELVNNTRLGRAVNSFTYAFRDERSFIGYANGVNDLADEIYRYVITLTTRTDPEPPAGWPAIHRWPPAWTVRTLEFATTAAALVADIVDSDIPGDRRINDLRLSEAGGSVTLTHTEVVHIHGPGDVGYRIVLGSATTRSVELAGGDDRVQTGTGFVRQIATGGGADAVIAGPGAVRLIDLGGGANRLEAAGAQISSVVALGQADTLVAGTGTRIGSADLGAGADSVTLTGNAQLGSLRLHGRATVALSGTAVIEQAFLDGPFVQVTLADAARILQLRTGAGTHRVTTGDGYLDGYTSAGGRNTLAIGSGGAGAITIGGAGTLELVAHGFVGMVQVPGDGAATLALHAGADQIRTGGGADRVTFTGAAFGGTLRTGAGNDTVTLGTGGALLVDLGAGDDTVHLAPTRAGLAVIVTGGEGRDTADFGRFAAPLALDLGQVGTVQPAAAGFVALSGIEHLTGGAGPDSLTGSEADNRLAGGGEADTLTGLAGSDTLAGGAGNDVLIGGAGADLFVFGRREGTDRIRDFEPGMDRIALAGVTALAQITFADTAQGVRLKAANTTVIVEGLTAADLHDPAHFLF